MMQEKKGLTAMSRSMAKRAEGTQSTTGGIALREEQRCPSIVMIRKVST